MSASSSPPRNVEIDRLRGVAIALVLMAHTGDWLAYRKVGSSTLHDALLGGSSGVDLFFVVSGYVVTGVLVPKIACAPRSAGLLAGAQAWLQMLRVFYTRRVFRILPASWTTLVAVLAAFALLDLVLLPASADRVVYTGKTALAALALCSNYFLYAEPPAAYPASPLGHTWSLGIEEQFYLVYPLFLIVVTGRRARIGVVALLALLVALVVRPLFYAEAVAAGHWPALFATHFRADGILVGCLLFLALGPRRGETPAPRGPALVGSAAAIAALPLARLTGTFPVSQPIVIVIAAVLVHLAARDRGWVLPLPGPATRVLASFGSRSYALYLVNWPILWLTDALWTPLVAAHAPSLDVASGWLVWLLASLACAEVLHRAVEKPMLRRGTRIAAALEAPPSASSARR